MAHAEPPPQVHAPEAQPSERTESHVAHAAPAVPHFAALGVAQESPSQQPAEQLVASHTHAPLLQRWPLAHAGPEPQRQAPAMQRSVVIATQLTHTAPPLPHSESLETRHVPSKQHPLGQVVPSQPVQLPPSHAPPAAQVWQARPPAPHFAGRTPVAQKSPSQQPPQVAGPQLDVPPPAPPAPPAAPPAEPPVPPEPPAPPPGPVDARHTPLTHESGAGQG